MNDCMDQSYKTPQNKAIWKCGLKCVFIQTKLFIIALIVLIKIKCNGYTQRGKVLLLTMV